MFKNQEAFVRIDIWKEMTVTPGIHVKRCAQCALVEMLLMLSELLVGRESMTLL